MVSRWYLILTTSIVAQRSLLSSGQWRTCSNPELVPCVRDTIIRKRPAFLSPRAGTSRRIHSSSSGCVDEIHPERNKEAETSKYVGRSNRSVYVIAECVDTGNDGLNFTAIAIDLAKQLSIPICADADHVSCPYTHALVVVPYHLGQVSSYAIAIHDLSNDSKRSRRKRPSKHTKSQPFFVDFCPPTSSRLGKRFEGHSGTDLLITAVSPRDQIVYDLTAGFGQDAVLMVVQGGASRVHMMERDPVVGVLLFDALRRVRLIASQGDPIGSQTLRAVDLAKRMTLEEVSDATQVVKAIISEPSAPRPDVCYLDPMFPTRTKTAAVKKNMQILHGLLGSQEEDDAQNETTERQELELLKAAWSLASRRVVVKRPRLADCLGGNLPNELKPSYSMKGSINRWDIYVK